MDTNPKLGMFELLKSSNVTIFYLRMKRYLEIPSNFSEERVWKTLYNGVDSSHLSMKTRVLPKIVQRYFDKIGPH